MKPTLNIEYTTYDIFKTSNMRRVIWAAEKKWSRFRLYVYMYVGECRPLLDDGPAGGDSFYTLKMRYMGQLALWISASVEKVQCACVRILYSSRCSAQRLHKLVSHEFMETRWLSDTIAPT